MHVRGTEFVLLTGKTAIISGAASRRGIGLATARLFADQGARIAILELDESTLQETAASFGEGQLGIACDITDRDACRRAVDAALQAFGYVDILVNNADCIRMNCVPPGLIQTDIAGDKLPEATKADIVKGVPLGHLGEAGNVANTICSWHRISPLTSRAQ